MAGYVYFFPFFPVALTSFAPESSFTFFFPAAGLDSFARFLAGSDFLRTVSS